jgi:hypothetical protein
LASETLKALQVLLEPSAPKRREWEAEIRTAAEPLPVVADLEELEKQGVPRHAPLYQVAFIKRALPGLPVHQGRGGAVGSHPRARRGDGFPPEVIGAPAPTGLGGRLITVTQAFGRFRIGAWLPYHQHAPHIRGVKGAFTFGSHPIPDFALRVTIFHMHRISTTAAKSDKGISEDGKTFEMQMERTRIRTASSG